MGQAVIPKTPASIDLTGKTVIVTGANAGLGLEAARQYLTLHASRVILAVRTLAKGEEASRYLSSHPSVKSTNPTAVIKVMALDLNDFQSVVRFSNKVKKELDVLNVLLLNGGVNIMSYQTSASGHERVMQVNFHSNALLALELLPLLESTAVNCGTPSRLTFVGSVTQKMHTVSKKPVTEKETVMEHFDDKSKYAGLQRYFDSKLMVAAFVQALAQHVPVAKVIINNLCPGSVATGFDVNLPMWLKPIMFVYRKLGARTVEEGARTLIYASVVAKADSHGAFILNNEITEPAPILAQPDGGVLKEKMWTETVKEAQEQDPQFNPNFI